MAQGFVAVHDRHHDVEQDQIRSRFTVGNHQGPSTRVRNPDPVILLQDTAHYDKIFAIVINHQNCRTTFCAMTLTP